MGHDEDMDRRRQAWRREFEARGVAWVRIMLSAAGVGGGNLRETEAREWLAEKDEASARRARLISVWTLVLAAISAGATIAFGLLGLHIRR